MTNPAKTTAVDDARMPPDWPEYHASLKAQRELEAQLSEQRTTIERLEAQVSSEELSAAKAWSEVDSLKLQVAQLEQDKLRLEGELTDWIDAHSGLKLQVAKLEGELRLERSFFDRMRDERDALRAQVAQLQTTISQLDQLVTNLWDFATFTTPICCAFEEMRVLRESLARFKATITPKSEPQSNWIGGDPQ